MPTITSVDDPGYRYVRLGLQIDRLQPGFVDGYYGPPELRAEIDATPPPEAAALLDDVTALQTAIQAAELGSDRHNFLTRQTRAMQTVLRRLNGERLSLQEEVEGCFDISPQRVDNAELDAILDELDTLLPGTGTLTDRKTAWQEQFELDPARIMPALETALTEVRRRTQQHFTLPPDEQVNLQLVRDEPWSGYNWYLGQGQSRIDINLDLPLKAHQVPDLMAHEAYPGHHTEHAIKEITLYRQQGRLEHSILLLLSPESTVAEAIATMALEIIFPDQTEYVAWLEKVYYPACGLQVDVAQQLALSAALEKLAGARGNAAFMLHEDGCAESDVVAYLQHYSLRSETEARQSLRFLSDSTFRAYIFNYFYGYQLLKAACQQGNPIEVFGTALQTAITPNAIASGLN